MCIGKVCPEDPSRMIPNAMYFSLFQVPLPEEGPQENASTPQSTMDAAVGSESRDRLDRKEKEPAAGQDAISAHPKSGPAVGSDSRVARQVFDTKDERDSAPAGLENTSRGEAGGDRDRPANGPGPIPVGSAAHPAEDSPAIGADFVSGEGLPFLEYGYTHAVWQIATEIGLMGVLESCLDRQDAADLMAVVAYRLQKGASLAGLEDWQESVFLPGGARPLDASQMSVLLRSLDRETRRAILAGWVEIHRPEDCVCYEIPADTADSNRNAEDGDGSRWNLSGLFQDCPQLKRRHLMCFVSLPTRRPLAYVALDEDVSDRSSLSRVMEEASGMGLERVHLFAADGFFSGDGFAFLRKEAKRFTIRMPLDSRASRKAVDAVLPEIYDAFHRIFRLHLQAMEMAGTVHQTKGRILVFYSERIADEENRSLDKELMRLEAELKAMKRPPKGSRYRQYFTITKREADDGFDFALDLPAIRDRMKYHGFFLFFTTDRTLTPEEILECHRENRKEGEFADPEDWSVERPPRGQRSRIFARDTGEGQLLIAFLAAILRSELRRRLTARVERDDITLETEIGRLSNIMVTGGKKGFRLARDLTEGQQKILDELGVADSFFRSIEALNRA